MKSDFIKNYSNQRKNLNPPVSVLMSVYGYADYIRSTIASVLEQCFQDFEFIIINDRCGYDLLQIISEYRDDRIVYLENKHNMGLTFSLIKGIKNARGKYIAVQDAGNISLPERLKKQFNFLEEYQNYFLVGSSAIIIDENNSELCKKVVKDDKDIPTVLPVYNCMNHSSIIFRNSGDAVYRAKFKYAQDYDLYLNLLTRDLKIGSIKDPLIKERFLYKSITFKKRKEQKFFAELAKKFYFERLKNGFDSYNSFEFEESFDLKNYKDSKGSNSYTELFYLKQSAYYLFYGGNTTEARKVMGRVLKIRLEFKTIIYFVLSFFPKLINCLRKIKKIDIDII